MVLPAIFFIGGGDRLSTVELTFSDNSVSRFPSGISLREVVKQMDPPATKGIIAARVDDQIVDLSHALETDARVIFLTFEDEEGKKIYWHSCAHIMAQAVKELFPSARLGIGPAIDNGFYYDFDVPESFTAEDLEAIENRMREIIQRDLPLIRQEVGREEARKIFEKLGEPFKLELLSEMDSEQVSIYGQDGFRDLCRGPHVPSTGRIGFVKLLGVAGAYWRGDERNAVLQRIYGIAFPREAELQEHLRRLEEAKKRDHRKLGRQLDLFSFHPEAPGFPFWHDKGLLIFDQCVQYWKKLHRREGYQLVRTPMMLCDDLWRCSGHWDNYREAMYCTEIDGTGYAIKPMNCPGGLLIYKNTMWSYRDFPLKMAELGMVHRHEKHGVLHGLFRVRQFTQDDAHIFCLPEQAEGEVIGVIDLALEIYNAFGFRDVYVELSTRPAKSIGSDQMWARAEETLRQALKKKEISYELNPGEGAFYGPKIDFHIEDSLFRRWQCGTIQVDFSMPERFELEYTGSDGEKHRPVMIHRALYGSLERFIGILIEHYGGDLPLWLAPVQARVIPVSRDHMEYATRTTKRLVAADIRAELDRRDEKIGYKIRDAETSKIPYMLVVGTREEADGSVSLRQRRGEQQGGLMIEDVIDRMKEEIFEKRS
jgi:threonyl-tRNA synthetase